MVDTCCCTYIFISHSHSHRLVYLSIMSIHQQYTTIVLIDLFDCSLILRLSGYHCLVGMIYWLIAEMNVCWLICWSLAGWLHTHTFIILHTGQLLRVCWLIDTSGWSFIHFSSLQASRLLWWLIWIVSRAVLSGGTYIHTIHSFIFRHTGSYWLIIYDWYLSI